MPCPDPVPALTAIQTAERTDSYSMAWTRGKPSVSSWIVNGAVLRPDIRALILGHAQTRIQAFTG